MLFQNLGSEVPNTCVMPELACGPTISRYCTENEGVKLRAQALEPDSLSSDPSSAAY